MCKALGLELSAHILIQSSEQLCEEGSIESCCFEGEDIEAQRD